MSRAIPRLRAYFLSWRKTMIKTLLKKEFSRYLSSNFNISKNKKTKQSSVGMKIVFAILMLYVGVVFVGLMTAMSFMLCEPLHSMGLSWLYFSIMAILALSMSLILGVFSTATQLYEAKDNELLLSMPIPPKTILASRIVFILIEELIIQLVIFVPAIVVYAIVVGMSAIQYVFAILIVLSMPFFTVSISAGIGWIIHVISSRVKNKSFISLALYLVFFGVYFLIYYKFQDYMQLLLVNGDAVAQSIKQYLYFFYCFGDAIANSSPLSLAVALLLTAALFALVYFILSKFFIKIATSKRGVAKVKYVRTEYKSDGVSGALVRKELKKFFSSSAYMLNSSIGLVLMLVASVFLLIKAPELQMLMQDEIMAEMLPAMLSAAPIFILSMNSITASSISLEGKNIWILRSSPIKAEDVIFAKLKASLIITLPILNVSIAIMSIAMFRDVISIILIFALSNAFAVFSSCFGLMMNLIKCRLDWDNETAVVKQSMSVTITMFSQIGIALFVYVANIFVAALLGVEISLAIFSIIMIGLTIMMYFILKTRGSKRFNSLNP